MTPKGFWSYARGDDAQTADKISWLRKRVADEVSMLLGEEIGMFQDIYDIRAGDDWAGKLRTELTESSFMIPVITPRYFRRDWCREEVREFLRLQEDAGRVPLLFPIYFMRDREFDAGVHDDVRGMVHRFQYFDFRELRFEGDVNVVDQKIHHFAEDLVERLFIEREKIGQDVQISSTVVDQKSFKESNSKICNKYVIDGDELIKESILENEIYDVNEEYGFKELFFDLIMLVLQVILAIILFFFIGYIFTK